MNFQARWLEMAPFRQPTPESDLLLRVRQALTERARRFDHFSSYLFADPAWDVLLQLYSAELSQEQATVSQLAEATNVPSTTTLRWIKMLQCEGLIARASDPEERGRVYLALTPEGSHAMHEYFHNATPNSGSPTVAMRPSRSS